MGKVILVTGASSGIGLACATALQAKGHTVYGSSRDLKRMKSVSFKPIELDVTDDASVNDAIDKIIKAEGHIDVLVNNAGNGVTGPAYAMPVESAKKQLNSAVNVPGTFLSEPITWLSFTDEEKRIYIKEQKIPFDKVQENLIVHLGLVGNKAAMLAELTKIAEAIRLEKH